MSDLKLINVLTEGDLDGIVDHGMLMRPLSHHNKPPNIPNNYIMRESRAKHGLVYYVNMRTQRVQWEQPLVPDAGQTRTATQPVQTLHFVLIRRPIACLYVFRPVPDGHLHDENTNENTMEFLGCTATRNVCVRTRTWLLTACSPAFTSLPAIAFPLSPLS